MCELIYNYQCYIFFWFLLATIIVTLGGFIYKYFTQINVLSLNISHVCMNPNDSKLKLSNCETDYYKKMVSIGSDPFTNAIKLIKEEQSVLNFTTIVNLITFLFLPLGCYQLSKQFPKYETIICLLMAIILIEIMTDSEIPCQAVFFQEIDINSENWTKLRNSFIHSEKSDWTYVLGEPQGKFNARVCTFYRKSVFGNPLKKYHGDFGWKGDGRPFLIVVFDRFTLLNAHLPQPLMVKKNLSHRDKNFSNSILMTDYSYYLQEKISKVTDLSTQQKLTIHPGLGTNNPTSAHGSNKLLKSKGLDPKKASLEERLECTQIFGSNKRGGIVVAGTGFSYIGKPTILFRKLLKNTYSDHFSVKRSFIRKWINKNNRYIIAGLDTNIGTGVTEGGLAELFFDNNTYLNIELPIKPF